jgi:hypothetical protein
MVNAVLRISRMVSSRWPRASAMRCLISSAGRSMAACRLSPTWKRLVMVVLSSSWLRCACSAATAAAARSASSGSPGLGDFPDHDDGELAGCGRDRAEADLGRERDALFAQPDQPRPGAHQPGPGCEGVAGRVAAGGRLQVDGEEDLDRLAEQLGVLVAEHLLQPRVGRCDRAVVVGQRHPVLEGVDQLPHRRGAVGSGPGTVGLQGGTGASGRAAMAASRDG